MPAEIHQVHLDFDGVMVELGKNRWQKIRKRDMSYVPSVENTVATIDEAEDFTVGSILTARFERRRASTLSDLMGVMPDFDERGIPLTMVGGKRRPYRTKIDTLAAPDRSQTLNILIDDRVHTRCATELADRMRHNPHGESHNYGGIVLAGYGMQYEQIVPLAKDIRDHFKGRPGEEGLAIGTGNVGTGVIAIRNEADERAFVVAMPSHEPAHVEAMLDTVRAIHPLVA